MRDVTRFLLRVAALLLTLAPMVALAQICTGLCLQQVICPNPAVTTTISGTVYAPNGVDPLPGVLVYIPNGPVDPLPLGATCRNGGTPPSSPLVQAISGIDGKFTVNNMPVGTSIPLVIQSGKWRRQSVIPNVPSCTNTPIAAAKTRFPTRQSEGDMPNLAVVTGANDAQECILRKIGIVDSEFTNSNGAGRVKLFGGANSPGATYSAASASETVLEASFATLDSYDMVMFSCQGDQYAQTPTAQQNLINYANAGGRVMATHYAYTWLYNDAPFSSTATWVPDQLDITADPQTGYINTTFPVINVEQGGSFAIEAQDVANHAPERRPQQVATLCEETVECRAVVLQSAGFALYGEGHLARLGCDAKLFEQRQEVRISAMIEDDEARVDGEGAALVLHLVRVRVTAHVRRGFEDRDVMIGPQMMCGDIARDAAADDCDLHRRSVPARI